MYLKKIVTFLILLLPIAATAQLTQATILARAATSAEKAAWTSLFDNKYAKKFITHYIDGTGIPILLNKQEVADLHPVIYFEKCKDLENDFNAFVQSNSSQFRTYNVQSGALGGTLGTFRSVISGHFVKRNDETKTYEFNGVYRIYDLWDFNWAKRGRPDEMRTRFASIFLPGRPFEIRSIAQKIKITFVGDKSPRGELELPAKEPFPAYSKLGNDVIEVFLRLFGG